MWLNENNIAYRAYWYCKSVNDDPEIRKHIRYSHNITSASNKYS